MLIYCVPTPNACAPHQQFDSTFPTLAACQERRDFILGQTSVFVLSADCYSGLALPAVKLRSS